MIKKIPFHFTSLKIRTQFLLLILLTGIFCFILFQIFWQNKWEAWLTAQEIKVLPLPREEENFFSKLYENAAKYSVPESENNTKEQEAFAPFFNICDDYTAIYIYDVKEGIYRAGNIPKYFYSNNAHFFNFLKNFTDNIGEESYELTLPFKNGYYTVMIYFYHAEEFLFFYYLFSFLCCVSLFTVIILFFINRKMQSVINIETEVLRMRSGDLTHAFSMHGNDEISILGRELNYLRLTLQENIQQEQESKKANQDLITALSHDLRTPLTILRGYLEVLQLKRNPQMQEEYLQRCLKKVDDIQELTNQMFEYALVSEEKETPEWTSFSTEYIQQCLQEHCDYIQLAGFQISCCFTKNIQNITSDTFLLKRIFTNLFSNILKYGEKQMPVVVSTAIQDSNIICISIKNAIKQEFSLTDSNHIGIKSVEKMVHLLHGTLRIQSTDQSFLVELLFPLE